MLADLLGDGLDHAQIQVGLTEAPTPGTKLLEAGARHFDSSATGNVVGALLTNDLPTAELIVGAVVSGTRLVSLPLPPRAANLETYLDALQAACRQYEITEVVARPDVSRLLESAGIPSRSHEDLKHSAVAAPSPSGFELVQYSSGSTSAPRPVELAASALEANIRGALERIQPTGEDRVVSWLPFSHDLGLVAMFLTSLVGGGREWASGGQLTIVRPEDFLRDPLVWMKLISELGATISAGPDFSLRMVSSKSRRPGLDLRQLRLLVLGGEIIRPDTLQQFAATYEADGFDPGSFSPAYGLAEIGVAVTLTEPDDEWWSVRASAEGLADGSAREPRDGERPVGIVSCGAPLDGYDVSAGTQDSISAVKVSGPSVGTNGATGAPFGSPEGWVETGDLGFTHRGQLFVVGRNDDYVVVHSRNIFAPPLESSIAELPEVRSGRVAVVGLPTGEWFAVLEARSEVRGSTYGRLASDVERISVSYCGARPDDVVVLPPGRFPLTSSGKLQRGEVRSRLLTGEIGGT